MASKTAKFKKKINGVIYDLNIISDANSIKVDDKGGTVASMLEGFNTKLQDLDTTIQEADPAGLRTDITTIQGEIATYNTKISTLETTVANQATEIDSKANADDVYDKIEVDTALAAKTDKEVAGTNGKALIFNEGDGGGAKFENSDNVTKSFAGVNDGVAGIYAQLYAVEKQSSGKSRGSKFDVTLGGIYYTTGQDSEGSPTDRDVSANELAVKGDLADLADTVYTKAEVDAAIAAAVPTTQAIEAIIENYLNTHNN